MRNIKNYEGLYGINEDSEIYNLNTGIQLKQVENDRGYIVVCLYKDKKPHTFNVHTLMALTYLDYIPNKGKVVHHINGIKSDNRLINLELTTQGTNVLKGSNNNTNVGTLLANGSIRVETRRGGVYKYIGTFKTQDEANKAYWDYVGS